MLGAVPPVAVVVDLMDERCLAISNPIHGGHARSRADRDTRIDRLDVTDFRKDVELHESFGLHFSDPERPVTTGTAPRTDAAGAGVRVKVGPGSVALKRHAPRGPRGAREVVSLSYFASGVQWTPRRGSRVHDSHERAVPALYELLQVALPEAVPTWTDVVVRLLAATAVGGAIGLDRELTLKPAGLRTHALVSLGAALATASALQLGVRNDLTHADAASRVIQGVVAGIGFIGGGVILHADGRNVKGLTTAASIFVAATLGISCGIGRWRVALSAAAIALAVLTLGMRLEHALHKLYGNKQPESTSKADDGDENGE